MSVRTVPPWARPQVRERVRLVPHQPTVLTAAARPPEPGPGSPNDSEEE